MIEQVEGKTHLVTKRDGRVEPYSPEKLYAVILWACNGSTTFADQLLQAVDIKIHNKIHITKLYDEVIATASNMISDLYPFWEEVAKNLYLLKLHKDLGVKRAEYPEYQSVVAANIDAGLYDSTHPFLTEENIRILGEHINPEYDKLFTFGGLNVFVQKYCNKHKGCLYELPQHVYMRVAVQLMAKEGMPAVIEKYKQIAEHSVTEATPKVTNSLKPNAQMFSCCLAKPEDSQESIDATIGYLARESKYGGGLATDISAIRAKGSPIKGNQGRSSGTTPFVQAFQAGTGAYNQGSSRSSALAVYYNWFHYESPEITMLKDENGKDEDRARKVKYAVKWTKQLSSAIKENQEVYLFDPHKTQDMTYAWGDNLTELYEKYSKSTHVRKRKYSARELAYTIAKVKVETGNLYTFFTDNANSQNIGCGDVTQSNLCVEYLPNFTSIKHIKDELVTTEDRGGVEVKDSRSYSGDIALCNLSSVNILKWVTMSQAEKESFMLLLVKSMNNAIDTAYYPNSLGRAHSMAHRNLGIGTSNYAAWLAQNKLGWDSPKARELTHSLYEELQYYAIKASIAVAKTTSKFPLFAKSKWAQGVFPHELSVLGATDSTLNFPLLMDWEALRKDLLTYGIANEYLMALAPTATSGKCINATEGVDAPKKLKTIEEGTYSLPFVVPQLSKYREYYQTRFDVSNKDTIELAAIRQKFICMGQSVSVAYKNPNSAYEVISDIMYAETLGLKSLYYTFTPQPDDLEDEECVSCGS